MSWNFLLSLWLVLIFWIFHVIKWTLLFSKCRYNVSKAWVTRSRKKIPFLLAHFPWNSTSWDLFNYVESEFSFHFGSRFLKLTVKIPRVLQRWKLFFWKVKWKIIRRMNDEEAEREDWWLYEYVWWMIHDDSWRRCLWWAKLTTLRCCLYAWLAKRRWHDYRTYI